MSTQPVALVTGTSSGIGLHTAVGLAHAGLRVVATMRDVDRSGALLAAADKAGVEVDVRQLDVVDEASATTCVHAVLEEYGRLDVLVNNAGRGAVGTLEQLSLADLQAQLDVNYLGVARLTKLVLPAMRAAGRGRIVTLTSVGGAVGQPFADAYCAAKFAVEGLMQSLAPVMAPLGVGISVVQPGAVGTEFVGNIEGVLTTRDPDDPYGGLLDAYLTRSRAAFAAAQTAEDAAAVVVRAATESWQFRWQTSEGAAAFVGLSLADLDGRRVHEQTATWVA